MVWCFFGLVISGRRESLFVKSLSSGSVSSPMAIEVMSMLDAPEVTNSTSFSISLFSSLLSLFCCFSNS